MPTPMTTDFHPNSLAKKIIKRFLANPGLIISAEELADEHGVTPTEIRRALAQAVGRDILECEANYLTGEQDYAAGRKLETMRQLLPAAEIEAKPAEAAPEASEADPRPSEVAAGADLEAAELVAIAGAGMPDSRIDLDELQLCDIPVPTGRAGVVSRYDGHFREALESGRAIAMPPTYVKAVADAARGWVRRHAPRHQVKSCGRLTGCHFGAVWIVKASSKKGGKV